MADGRAVKVGGLSWQFNKLSVFEYRRKQLYKYFFFHVVRLLRVKGIIAYSPQIIVM
jgi:hypothetical protein